MYIYHTLFFLFVVRSLLFSFQLWVYVQLVSPRDFQTRSKVYKEKYIFIIPFCKLSNITNFNFFFPPQYNNKSVKIWSERSNHSGLLNLSSEIYILSFRCIQDLTYTQRCGQELSVAPRYRNIYNAGRVLNNQS